MGYTHFQIDQTTKNRIRNIERIDKIMTQKNAQKYIKALGLENAHNGLKRMKGNGEFRLSTDQEIIMTAYKILWGSIQKYGMDYRATMYVMRNDGNVQLMYNDHAGINCSLPENIEFARGMAERFSADEDYLLMVETEPGRFSVVTQM